MFERGWTINGFPAAPRDMTQLGIVRNLKNGMRHFTRVIPFEADSPVKPLCSVKGNNRITKYQIVGQLFDLGASLKRLDINHEKDFCQSCKKGFRGLFNIDLTSFLLTTTLPEEYPGQPPTDRFVFFGSSHRDGRGGQAAGSGDAGDS